MQDMQRIVGARLRVWSFATLVVLATSCASVDPEAVPPDVDGRPVIVRGAAYTGGAIGEFVGVVAWLPLWPVTKGIGLLADEPFGYSQREWMLMPITAFASLGHYALGLPAEALYFVFYGAWVDEPPPSGFEHVPARPASATTPPRR